MLTNVRSWWGASSAQNEADTVSAPDENTLEKRPLTDDNALTDAPGVASTAASEEAPNLDGADVKKAINVAKQWGSYLYTVGKSASQVAAKSIKEQTQSRSTTVTNMVPIMDDFSREQEQFVQQKRDRRQRREAKVPPWIGYPGEESLREQILALSLDSRNFLRNPPAGADFQFDPDTFYPMAVATLAEDPNLVSMRFQLVPKKVVEDRFWHNYFYRVSLIKQSMQLTASAESLAETQRVRKASNDLSGAECDAMQSEGSNENPFSAVGRQRQLSDSEDFVSDNPENVEPTQNLSVLERQALGGATPTSESPSARADAADEWEMELQRELNEIELAPEAADESNAALSSTGSATVDEEDLEREIMAQIDSEQND